MADVAVLMQRVLSRIEVREKAISLAGRGSSNDLKYLHNLFKLKSDAFELLEKLLRLAGTDTNTKQRIMKILSFHNTKRGIGSRHKGKTKSQVNTAVGESKAGIVELELHQAQADSEIGGKFKKMLVGESKGSSVEFELLQAQADSQIGGKLLVGESKGSSVEFELQQAQADSEIGGKFKKMLLSLYELVARSIEVPKGSFELGCISWLFDQIWDITCQLQLASPEARILATSMLTDKTFVKHVSALQLCSQDVDWLCTWVPEFMQRLQRVKKDDRMRGLMYDGAEMEDMIFAGYISNWERVRRRNNCISFEDSTPLSSMLFTRYMPGHHPLFADLTETMQIFSIKVAELEEVTEFEGFEWPLEVYGVVAARDAVDYRRNILFLRTRDNCQFLTKEDSCLHLTGPSRAILSTDKIHIEIQLKVKGTMKSEDRPLITKAFACSAAGGDDVFVRHTIKGFFCRMELCCGHVKKSIQATIVSVRVKEGSLFPADGFKIICSSLPEEGAEGNAEDTTSEPEEGAEASEPEEGSEASDDEDTTSEPEASGAEASDDEDTTSEPEHTTSEPEEGAEGNAEHTTSDVVLLDQKHGTVTVDEDGYLDLSRQVVSVGLAGRLKLEFVTNTVTQSAVFEPKSSNISKKECILGDCKLEITVAWSLLVEDERDILMMTYTKPCLVPSKLPFMKLG